MKTSAFALGSVAWVLLVGGVGAGCQSGPGTSSSSNWVVCELPVDCSGVPDAVDCEGGYCVDAEGERIERPANGTGGATSSDAGNSSGGGDAVGGTTSGGSGGSALGSGGDPQNLGGATGSGGAAATCDDFSAFSSCEENADCVSGQRVTDCCGTTLVTGVAIGQEEAFSDLALECSLLYPACGCPSPAYPLTDDGRWLTTGEAFVSCVDGQCKTQVPERPCGETTCDLGEICVRSSTVTGPTQSDDYSCVANPCADEALDCSCAQAACELGDGRSRLCSVSLGETSDILCEDQSQ